MFNSSAFSPGDWVEVRSREEILLTLDRNSCLDGLPFMPEMLEFCGRRFRVAKRAHKTCDPPEAPGRKMEKAVHLDGVRCDGAAHDGCQARCLIFWKDAWLRPVDGPDRSVGSPSAEGCTVDDIVRCSRAADSTAEDPTYVCQNTRVGAATRPLHWWDPRQYVEDYLSGNVTISDIVGVAATAVMFHVATAGIGLSTPVRWLYDAWASIRGNSPFPWRHGRIPRGTRTPAARIDVKPGELVQIKTYEEILATVDERNMNRGMLFDVEMVPYTGKSYRVLDRVSRIISERTGKMNYLSTDCIMLEDVVCRSCYSKYRRFCPRGIYSFWREIWLERVG